MAWPVCISSTCPLRAPVDAHWATNWRCDRLMMRIVTAKDAGTASSETTARIGLIVNIIDQHPDDREQRRDELGQALLERLADVVDVVGHAAEQVAARPAVEGLEWQATELRIDVGAKPEHGPLRDAGHDVGLHPGEQRAQHVHPDEHEQDACEGVEIDALAGRQRTSTRACSRAGPDPTPEDPRRPGRSSRRTGAGR